MPETTPVAVIGLGTMGLGAAQNLLAKGFAVTGCDPSAAARANFAGPSVDAAAAMPQGTEAVVVFVVNAAQAEAALFGPNGCVARLAPGAVIIQCATVAPDAARALAERAAAGGFLFVDAPGSGGSDAAFAKADTVLGAFATRIFKLAAEPGIGSTVKMINQLLAGVHLAATGEAMALAIRAGADPRTVYEVISGAAGASWMFNDRVPRLLEGDDTPKSAVNIFVKDLGIVLDAGRSLQFPLPMASAAHQLFLAAASAGYGARDDGFVARVWEKLGGITLPTRS
jgi:3-hydroxyisobutyrate dehydrogenase-like beta-hydroxyacid dehydrogenase